MKDILESLRIHTRFRVPILWWLLSGILEFLRIPTRVPHRVVRIIGSFFVYTPLLKSRSKRPRQTMGNRVGCTFKAQVAADFRCRHHKAKRKYCLSQVLPESMKCVSRRLREKDACLQEVVDTVDAWHADQHQRTFW